MSESNAPLLPDETKAETSPFSLLSFLRRHWKIVVPAVVAVVAVAVGLTVLLTRSPAPLPVASEPTDTTTTTAETTSVTETTSSAETTVEETTVEETTTTPASTETTAAPTTAKPTAAPTTAPLVPTDPVNWSLHDQPIDGWVYLRGRLSSTDFRNGLCRVRADGSQGEILFTKDLIGDYVVLGNWIYFSADSLYRMHTDGSGLEKLKETKLLTNLYPVGKMLYYSYLKNDANGELTGVVDAMDTTTLRVTEIPNMPGISFFQGTYFGYIPPDYNTLYLYKLDGTPVKTVHVGSHYMKFFKLLSDHVLAFTENGKLYTLDFLAASPQVREVSLAGEPPANKDSVTIAYVLDSDRLALCWDSRMRIYSVSTGECLNETNRYFTESYFFTPCNNGYVYDCSSLGAVSPDTFHVSRRSFDGSASVAWSFPGKTN